MTKKLLFLFFLFIALSISAQRDTFWVRGKIIDSAGVVKNVNILNLKSNKGTFSNDFGDYKMIVSIGDTLKFTSVQHQTVIRVIDDFIYTSEVLDVYLAKKTYVLDEVVVKEDDLSGYLSIDRNRTPVDRKGEALKKTLDFSKVDFSKKLDDDHIDQKVRPNIVRVDPTMAFIGAGATALIPFKYSERLWALRKDLDFRMSFPGLLLGEFGEKFFQDDLKIPQIRYYHFLEYCNPLGIEKLYEQNKKIELIDILRRESKNYLKLIKQEEE
tara:strand:+ start:45037 stop:45846 length:810 start_codon:yes stop_codon:yes gene_type:complete